jgi:hypothetical protein
LFVEFQTTKKTRGKSTASDLDPHNLIHIPPLHITRALSCLLNKTCQHIDYEVNFGRRLLCVGANGKIPPSTAAVK